MNIRTTILLLTLALAIGCGGGGYDAGDTVRHFYGPTEMAVEPNVLEETGPLIYTVNTAGANLTVMESIGFEIVKSYTDDRYNEKAIWLGEAPIDIAVTPDGDRLYVTDARTDAVRLVELYDPWPGEVADLVLRDARVAVVPVAYAPETYAAVAPPAWDARHEVWFTDRDNDRLLVWDHQRQALVDAVELPAEPVNIEVSRDGETVYVLDADANLLIVDAAARELTGDVVDLGGWPTRLVETLDGSTLFVLNNDPPRLQVVETDRWALTEDEITFPLAINGMALSTDGKTGFISSDDGNVYYFFVEQRRACGSAADRPYFYDEGRRSNPTLEEIETTDCVTREEEWELTFKEEFNAWQVEGTRSGLQYNLAYSDQRYESDYGHVSFRIRRGELRESDDDHFKFRTRVGVAPIRVGLVPTGISVVPYYFELSEDLVFVANSGSHSLSRIYTEEDENLGAIE